MEGMSYTNTRFALDVKGLLEMVIDKLRDFELEENESLAVAIDDDNQVISIEMTRYENGK